jgi:hypothetical protein
MTDLELLRAAEQRRIVRDRGAGGYTIDGDLCDDDVSARIDGLLAEGLLFVNRQRDIDRALVCPSVRAVFQFDLSPVSA